MTRARTIAACHRASAEALRPWNDPRARTIKQMAKRAPIAKPVEDRGPEWEPNGALDRQILRARLEMGEARWAELNAESGYAVTPLNLETLSPERRAELGEW